jgi:hypothetical protein
VSCNPPAFTLPRMIEAHVRGANMLFQIALGRKGFAAGICAVPGRSVVELTNLHLATREWFHAFMNRFDMYHQVPSLREAPPTARLGAVVKFSFRKTLSSMQQIKMSCELPRSGATKPAIGTCWRMDNFVMGLQVAIRRKSHFDPLAFWSIFVDLGLANHAPIPVSTMHAAPVGLELSQRIKPLSTISAILAGLLTDEEFLSLVNRSDVLLQRVVFPEDLSTPLEMTLVFLPPLVCRMVSIESLSRCERLPAIREPTHIVTDIGMGRLDMVPEMGFTEVPFIAALIWTCKNSRVCMGASVFLQSGRSIERFVTARLCAMEPFDVRGKAR